MVTLLRAARGFADRTTLLIVLLGLTLGGVYFASIDLRDPAFSFGLHERIIGGDAGSPYRYRVLVPILLEALTRAFALVEPRELAFLHASAVYDCLGLVIQLLALYALARQWFSPRQSLVGVAFVTGVTLATFSYFTYQPWSILEVSFFSLGFLFAYWGCWGAAGGVVLFASLNRETGIFLPLALLLASLDARHPFDVAALRRAVARREPWLAFGFVVMSAAVFAGLRLLRGSAAQVDALSDVFTRNLEPDNLTAGAMVLILFLGFGWIFAVSGWRRAPLFIRGVGRVVPVYLAAFAIWGWWREVRILTTLYPILMPLVLAYCYQPRR
ncbi:MAG: hypothetical protein M3069_33245 [Chloroflexota bacterium]|nr:hypothetical protein [Chloroflexota bacterium]